MHCVDACDVAASGRSGFRRDRRQPLHCRPPARLLQAGCGRSALVSQWPLIGQQLTLGEHQDDLRQLSQPAAGMRGDESTSSSIATVADPPRLIALCSHVCSLQRQGLPSALWWSSTKNTDLP